MKEILELVNARMETEKISNQEKKILNKICKLEKNFLTGLDEKKLDEYMKLENEKDRLQLYNIEHTIKITYEIVKNILR